MAPLLMASVLVTLTQTIDNPPLPELEAAFIEMVVEAFFTLEICLRFAFCPSCRAFFFSPYNVLDLLSATPLIVRFSVGCKLPTQEGSFSRDFLLCGVPVLRVLRMLRRFSEFQILLQAFVQAFEALPVLLFTLGLIVLTFSGLIYLAEPRENIDSLPKAIWLSVVSMTTVGYGDVTPVSGLGSIIVGVLLIISVLYMAMPIGIIGYTFNQVWKERDKILLMQRARERLAKWGYTANDVVKVFKLFDSNQDGNLDWEEFNDMIRQMRIGLDGARVKELFQAVDKDGGGSIDEQEFVHAVFPTEYESIYGEGPQTSLARPVNSLPKASKELPTRKVSDVTRQHSGGILQPSGAIAEGITRRNSFMW